MASAMLARINLDEIEENDPMKKGPTTDYQEDLRMMVKLKTFTRAQNFDDEAGLTSEEVIHMKVLSTGDDDIGGGNIYIELTSEDDLFFHYKCE